VDGLLLVDKPAGPTSHDVVARARRILNERRIGHTGTLDPFASGVLPLVIGRATRLARFLSASDKTYEAIVRLGVATDSGDVDGTPIGDPYQGALPTRAAIDRALDAFRGTFLQQPPALSAKKIGGRRSHRLARARGAHRPAEETSPLPARVPVTAAIELAAMKGDTVTLIVQCSAGFYIRSLANDLGAALGTGAHVVALRRTRSGDLMLDVAIPLADLEQDPSRAAAAVIPMSKMLPGLARVVLTPEGVRRTAHGRDLGPADFATGTTHSALEPSALQAPAVRLVDSAGELVAIAERSAGSGLLHPSVVLM
jgi:tRNA pseudouridine55 synthase